MGCGQKSYKASVAVPPAPLRVPSQMPLAPSVRLVTSVANDKGDNEIILRAVHVFLLDIINSRRRELYWPLPTRRWSACRTPRTRAPWMAWWTWGLRSARRRRKVWRASAAAVWEDVPGHGFSPSSLWTSFCHLAVTNLKHIDLFTSFSRYCLA